MKKLHLFSLLTFVLVLFASCEKDPVSKTTLIDFEDVTLNEKGYTMQTFTSKNITFKMNGDGFWNGGIAGSNNSDVTTGTYENQYSSIVGKGANGSTKYGVIYAPATIVCTPDANGAYSAKSLMLTNTTYAYYVVKDGNDYSKKFAGGDWFKVTVDGYYNKQKTSVEYYLADFRDGKSFISKEWSKLDISNLGLVDSLKFTLESSDTGDWGMNTPAYLCIDNMELTQEIKE